MLKKILLAFALAIVVLGIVIQVQPNTYSVQRSVTIAAPPATVFPMVNDFHNWGAWSPWEKLDPAMKRTYAGPGAGTDSVYEWAGNKQAGAGRMRIVESRPNELVRIKLDFVQPFPSSSMTNFTMKPDGGGTNLTWDMTGDSNFMVKAMGLFSSMDKMIGPDFERGLAQMKARAEATKS